MTKLLELAERMDDLKEISIEYSAKGTFSIAMPKDMDDRFSRVHIALTANKANDKATLATVDLVRIPSDLGKMGIRITNYDTEEAMKNSTISELSAIAHALHIGEYHDFADETQPIDVFDAMIFSDLYYIENFCVENGYRGYGIGSALIDALPSIIKFYCGGEDVFFATFTDDMKLARFYQKHGFKSFGNGVYAKQID